MKVKELIKLLQEHDGERKVVVMQSDSPIVSTLSKTLTKEVCDVSNIGVGTGIGLHDFYSPGWTAKDAKMEEEEWKYLISNGLQCLALHLKDL